MKIFALQITIIIIFPNNWHDPLKNHRCQFIRDKSMKTIFLPLIFVANLSNAQQACNELLKHGIVDRVREQKIDNRSTVIQNQICAAYNSYKSDAKSGGIKANYEVFGGSANYSGTQIESVGKVMCESNFSDSASKALLETSSDKINPDAVGAWRICAEQYADGLRAETDFRNDNGTVAISLRYVVPSGSKSYPEFSGVVVSPSMAFTCKGPLAKAKDGTKFSTDSIGMLCERNMAYKESTLADGSVILVSPATISVITTAGTITRHVAAVFKSPPPVPQRLGDVVASLLSEASFREINGRGWVLADGRAVPGTQYEKIVAAKVPDLRGIYLRGKNYERDKASGNADGDLPIGAFQKFEIIKHSHSTVQMIFDNNVDGVDSAKQNSYEHHNEDRQTGEYGGNEVRPNSVTINYFVKVDA